MNHLSEQLALRYIAENLSEDEMQDLDLHIADCPQCLDRIRTLRYIAENFDTLLESWTAEEHGRVYQQWRLVKAFEEAAEASPSLAERIRNWLAQKAGTIEIGVSIVLDRASKVATAAAASLPEGYGFSLRPAFEGVGSPADVEQLKARLQRGSELLADGKPKEAIKVLLEASRIDALSPQAAVTEIRHGNRLALQLTVNGRQGRIWVKARIDPQLAVPQMALLIPTSPHASASIAEFKPVQGEQVLVAEFIDVGDGPYTIEIMSSQAPPRKDGVQR
ncbi:MAG: hypothetical protein ACYS30_23055 [Planctomycetota bacterium]|jgi:hypothetical protein